MQINETYLIETKTSPNRNSIFNATTKFSSKNKVCQLSTSLVFLTKIIDKSLISAA